MRFLKKTLDFYVFSNMHVAIACFSLAKLSLLFFNIQANTVPLFVFFSTIVSYNYIRLTRIKQIETGFSNWLEGKRIYLIIIIILSFMVCVYLLLQVRLEALFVLIPFGFLTGLYVLPAFLSKKINLRNLPTVKIFVISFSWAGITVLFPLIQHGLFDKVILLLFLRRFLFVVVLTLPFDIRDVSYDAKSLKTLPIWLGVTKAKVLGSVFLGLFLVITFFLKDAIFLVTHFDFLMVIVLLAFLLKSTVNQNKYYSAFWVESIPILWLGLYLIFA
ncbi:MAG: hypothetical protein L3J45_01510 [Flavobacteriaceae bacterium]|nr:hypothetical protein [Flavobacteriaceae bacterium]